MTTTPTTEVTTSTTEVTTTPESTTTDTSSSTKEQMVPLSRFKEINDQLKEFKTIAEEYNAMKKDAEVKKLKDKWDFEAALNKMKEDYDAKIKSYEEEKFGAVKSQILTKYSIDEDLAKFVTGSTAEELEEAAKLLSSKIQKQKEDETLKNTLPTDKKEEKKGSWNIQNLDFSVFFK